jgi:hypothetical protein
MQVNAQSFQIGSPSKTQLRGTPEWTASKQLYGDRFVRTGNVVLNRSNRDDCRIQEALLSENLLSIRLFDDLLVTARKINVRITANNGVYWTGECLDKENTSLTLYMLNSLLSGTLRTENAVFDISPAPDGNLKVVELDLLNDPSPDEDCYDEEERPKEEAQPRLRSSQELLDSPTIDADGNYIVDILILYPDEVAAQMGTTPEARTNQVQLRIEEANEIFENSQMNVRFRLAHHEINNLISKSATSAGDVATSAVKTLRNQYGADIVSHWNYNGSAGSGYVWSSASQVINTGFNTSKYSDVISRYTFVHECGHNLGARHDRHEYYKGAEGSSDREKLMQAPGYQFGKCFLTYRTIMAYDNSKYLPGATGSSRNRIKHFSNPDVLYNGVPTGVAGNAPEDSGDGGPANNAKRINECAPSVSACRNSVVTNPTGIPKEEYDSFIQVYPNPATDYITIGGLQVGTKIVLSDLYGRKLLQTTTTTSAINETISIVPLPRGIYLLQAGGVRIKIVKK